MRTVNNQVRHPSDIDLTSFYAPYTAAYYKNPIVTLFAGQNSLKQQTWDGESYNMLFKSKQWMLHFYAIKGINNFLHFRTKNVNNRPALVCLQDKGDEVKSNAFERLSAFFQLGPSSFEKNRALPSINSTAVYGHRGIGYPRPDEQPIMENSKSYIITRYYIIPSVSNSINSLV